MKKLSVTTPFLFACLLSGSAFGEDKKDKKDEKDEKEVREEGSKGVFAIDGFLSSAVNAGENPVGGGVGGRIGWHYTALEGLLALRPEFGGNYTNVVETHIGRVFGGGRFGAQFLVLGAYAYGHAGYGWGTPDDDLTWDVGAAVDLILFEGLRPGVHVEYAEIVDNIELLNVGIHIEFIK